MKNRDHIDSPHDNIEHLIATINAKIEDLKAKYNLYFTGELRVPPESEREEIEKMVRDLVFTGQKTPRSNLLTQNLSSKFSLYNNMWKKKLSEIEAGMVVIKKKKIDYIEGKKPAERKEDVIGVSLNSEESFEKFYEKYALLFKKDSKKHAHKEKVINSLKAKLISQNLIDAEVSLYIKEGKLKLKIKR